MWVSAVIMWGNKLALTIVVSDALSEGGGSFIVQALEFGLEAFGYEATVELVVGKKVCSIVTRRHWFDKDSIGILCISAKMYLLP